MITMQSWWVLPIVSADYIPDFPMNENLESDLDRIAFKQKCAIIDAADMMHSLAILGRAGRLSIDEIAEHLEMMSKNLTNLISAGKVDLMEYFDDPSAA